LNELPSHIEYSSILKNRFSTEIYFQTLVNISPCSRRLKSSENLSGRCQEL
jgi:hypothetical protein